MAGWQSKSLGDVAHFINGLWKGEEPPLVHVGVIRNTNFTKDGALNDADIAYLDVEAKKFQKRWLQFGDLILEKSGGGPKQPVGRVVLFDKTEGDFSFSNFTAAIRIVDPAALDSKFLHKYLHWVYVSGRTEAMQSHSTGIRNLNGDAYKAIEVAYPSLPEQQRIVALLDEAFEGIATAKANAEKNLQNSRDLCEELMQALFPEDSFVDADAPSLDSLCELIVDCEHKTAPTQESGIPSIRTPNIGKGRLLLDGVYRVSEATYEEWTRRAKPQAGDLILAREAPAGNVAVVPPGMKVCLGQRTVLIRPKKSILESDYLAQLLLRQNSQRRLLAHSRGATVQHINMKDIRAFKIAAVPSLEAQRGIVARINELFALEDRLITIYSGKLTALDELKKSLLHQAFTGQL